jgi:hypothetical protein
VIRPRDRAHVVHPPFDGRVDRHGGGVARLIVAQLGPGYGLRPTGCGLGSRGPWQSSALAVVGPWQS